MYRVFGPKNPSFWNKSGKMQPIRTKFGMRGQVKGDDVQEILGWSAHFGQNGGWDESHGAQVFFVWSNHATFQQLRNSQFSTNLIMKHSSVSRRWIREDIVENFYFTGHFPPKSEIEIRSNRHLTQSRLQVTGCIADRYCLLHIVVQVPGSFRGPSTFLYDVRLCQSCTIFRFRPIFPIQNP